MTLLVLVPSRGRPESAHRLKAAFNKTRVLKETRLLFVLDSDDETIASYPEERLVYQPSGRKGMVDPLNKAALGHAKSYNMIGFMGDDHLPKTVGWDDFLYDSFDDDGSHFIYGNDLLQGEKLPTACMVSTEVILALGYMAPPVLQHLYVDNFWRDLGKATNSLAYDPDIVIEHLHFTNGKSQDDKTYQEANAAVETDRLAYLEYIANGAFARDVMKVLALAPRSVKPPEYQSEGLGDF